MGRQTSFRWALRPTAAQEQVLRRHAGASRFAYNQCRRFVTDALEKRQRVREAAECEGASQREAQTLSRAIPVPWSGYDLINAFNAWKRSEAAGLAGDGEVEVGLAWTREVCAQVFEEAATDCSRALEAWSTSRREAPKGRRVGFPVPKRRGRCRDSFRMRNRINRARPRSDTGRPQRHMIRVGDGSPRSVSLPIIGTIRVHDDTRPLRRMVAKGRARILFATVSRHGERWYVSLNCEATAVHPGQRWTPGPNASWIGIDRGITTFAVVADQAGRVLERIEAPRPLRANLRLLRRESRAVGRRQRESARRAKAVRRISRRYARIRDVRHTFLHQTSSRLLKTHERLAIEDLNTAAIVTNRHLSRSVSDLGWGEFARILAYKANWREAQLAVIDRWFPSTKTCSVCGNVLTELGLETRIWTCPTCGVRHDRDVNAAINLAVCASRNSAKQTVAPKQGSTKKARGGKRSGPAHSRGETVPSESSTEPSASA